MKLLCFLFFLLPLRLWAQNFPLDAASGKIYYAEEVLVKDGPQADLYQRAKAWFASACKDKRDLQTDDPTDDLVTGSSYSLLSVYEGSKNQTFKLGYTIKLQLADDRYWYSISDFQLQREPKAKAATAEATFTNRQPLEAVVFSKNNVNREEKEKRFTKLVEEAAHQSILMLIKDLQAGML